MKKVTLFVLTIIGITIVFYISCKKDKKEPVADFSAPSQTVYAYQRVQFTDKSENSPTAWVWIFQNGVPSTSNLQNPVVYWIAGGQGVIKNVTLTASNSKGSNSVTKQSYITVKPNVTVWSNFNGPQINVYLSPSPTNVDSSVYYIGKITIPCTSGNPDCGTSGCVSANYNGRVYYYCVEDTPGTHYWDGFIDIDSLGCNTIKIENF